MSNKLESGFSKGDSRNLPKVDSEMILEFISKDERFNSPEVRGAKANVSSREKYGDNAIGYVCVKREGALCTAKGKICPEHSVRKRNYSVVVTIKNAESIENLECIDCAAAQGGCKHAFDFLMWLHRRSEEPSCTETTCYWKKSVLSSIGSHIKFIEACQINNRAINVEDLPDNSSFLTEVISKLNEKQVDVQLSRYTITLQDRLTYNLSLHQILLQYSKETVSYSADDFILFAKEKLNEDLCKQGERETKQQSKNLLWYDLRYGRITGSKIYEASKCHTPEGSLVKQIIGASKLYDSASMERGRNLEDEVFKELQVQGYNIEKCGFMLIPTHPILGASPDGLGSDFIVEIKCPSKENTFKNYLNNGQITGKCKAQMLLQMFAAKKKRGLFCVADYKFEENKKINIVWIDYDDDSMKLLIEEATKFWKENIYSTLIKYICTSNV